MQAFAPLEELLSVLDSFGSEVSSIQSSARSLESDLSQIKGKVDVLDVSAVDVSDPGAIDVLLDSNSTCTNV